MNCFRICLVACFIAFNYNSFSQARFSFGGGILLSQIKKENHEYISHWNPNGQTYGYPYSFKYETVRRPGYYLDANYSFINKKYIELYLGLKRTYLEEKTDFTEGEYFTDRNVNVDYIIQEYTFWFVPIGVTLKVFERLCVNLSQEIVFLQNKKQENYFADGHYNNFRAGWDFKSISPKIIAVEYNLRKIPVSAVLEINFYRSGNFALQSGIHYNIFKETKLKHYKVRHLS